MRWDYLKLRGIGPFRDEVELDLTKLGDARIVAVSGTFGAGKSTLLEVGMLGALDRRTPTRGTLLDLATARDAFVESRLANGSNWTFRHMLDGVAKKAEAVVLRDGEPVLPDTKVKSFDAWRARALPASSLLCSSTFGVQGDRGFLDMGRTERVEIILKLAGAEHLEALAERCREHARKAREALTVAAARLEDERARGGDVPALERTLGSLREQLPASEATLERLEVALSDAERLKREHESAVERVRERARERNALFERAAGCAARLQDLEKRLGNNRAVLADAEAIRRAVAQLERTQTERQAAAERQAEADKRRTAALAAKRSVEQLAADNARVLAAAERRVTSAQSRLSDASTVTSAVKLLPEMEAELVEIEGVVNALDEQRAELTNTRLAGADERITGLRGALTSVAAGCIEPREVAGKALLADDEHVEQAATYPARVSAADEQLKLAREQLAKMRKQVDAARTFAARQAEIDQAREELTAAAREIDQCTARRVDHETDLRAALNELVESEAELSSALAAVREADTQLVALKALAAKAGPLEAAEARVAELEPQVVATRAERDELERELASKPALDTPPAPTPPRAQDVEERRAQLAEQRRAVARTEAQLEAARAASARIAELSAERDASELELSDWNQLAADLGRDGLQAMEVDAAGPKLTALTNDLLHTCYGPRFTVRIDSQRASADGKRLLEGCDVMALDSQEGREAEGSTFSGGERSLLAEALSLAIAMFSGVGHEPTIVRDESASALPDEFAPTYIAMLRRCAAYTGASRVLLISHSEAFKALCDARINVGNRGIEVSL